LACVNYFSLFTVTAGSLALPLHCAHIQLLLVDAMEEELQDMLRRLQQEELVLKEALYASEKPEELHAREKKEAEEAEEKGEKRLTAALAAAMGDDSASSSSSDSE